MSPAQATVEPNGRAANRDLARFSHVVIRLAIALMLMRAFLIEPSHVPTGSMAPHRLGDHLNFDCPDCGFAFVVGISIDGTPARPICPNCGSRQFDLSQSPSVQAGDRLWISKSAWAFTDPKRWDEVVFYAPGAPLTPHLKRIVGLPGERLRVADGDVFVNGSRLRKDENERKRLSILVFDSGSVPREGTRPHRWRFELENGRGAVDGSRWYFDTGSFRPGSVQFRQFRLAFRPENTELESKQGKPWDWAHYAHFCPIRSDYGPVRDFLSYDGPDDGKGNVVGDLWFSARVEWRILADAGLQFRLTTAEADLRVTFEVVAEPNVVVGKVMVNGETIKERKLTDRASTMMFEKFGVGHHVEMSWVDHRLEFRIAGRPIFGPIDLENVKPRRPEERFRDSPAGFAVRGCMAVVDSFRLYRDIHYTNRLATEPVIGHGVRDDVELPPDGFFVLGDDSAHSVDSRFFEAGPAVPRSALIGRPLGQGRDSR
jgi:signal peptidase I